MLRSTIEAGLNDLHVRLLETAHLYALLAERNDAPALAELYGKLSTRRRKAAGMTEHFIRRLDALPDVPDTDWETLEQLFDGAMQAFGYSQSVMERALEHEDRLADAVAYLIKQPVSGDTKQFLEQLQLEVQNARKRLKEAQPGGTGPTQ